MSSFISDLAKSKAPQVGTNFTPASQSAVVMFDKEALQGIRDCLLKEGESLAVAESVTSGFLQASFSTVPDASNFFQGGITVYNLAQKYRHLLVNPIHAEACNCVSEQVARQMAVEVCKLFGSQWGLAITGYATKKPEGDDKLFAWYAISKEGKVLKAAMIEAEEEEGEETQVHFVNEVLTALQKTLNTQA